ncbi:MAG: hypothetical protein J6A01_11465 [Proteobacteria bacterium]|nr:hypothetical protein [Pseudomonadota bacterium]
MDIKRIAARYLSVIGIAGSLTICAQAFADGCSNLDGNPQWNEGMNSLSALLTAKKWDDALKTAENLNTICERSPMLNYAMGRIYREKGNDSKALYYYQRATLYTEEFAVKGKTLELMWFDRYEAEHPEARPEVIASRNQEIEQLKAQAQQSHEKDLMRKTDEQYGTLTEKAHYGAGMWTGVALMGVGAAMTIAGAVLEVNNNKPIEYIGGNKQLQEGDKDYRVNSLYATSWVLIGVGVAATVAGSVVTGLMGYYYTHTQVAESPVSFHISPISADLTIQF